MFSNDGFISVRQLKILLMLDIFGKSITIFPRRVVEIGGQNGWLIVVLGLIFSVTSLFVINSVAKKYPNDSFVDYVCKIAGKPLGILISIGFIAKIIINVSLELRIFSEILKEIMLFNTPFFIISFSMLFVGTYMASRGYEARGRIAEILVFVVFIPLAFVFFITIFDVDFSNLKPFLKEINGAEMIGGGIYSLFYFSGIEFVFLIYPYIREKKKVQKATISSTIMIGIVMIFISVITIARFGKYDIVHQILPVLEMMDTIDLPGSFIERQDAFIMTFWIIAIFMIINSGIFFSSLIFKDLLKKGTHSRYIYICAIVIYIISFLPKNISQTYKAMEMSYIIFGTLYIIVLPLFLLIMYKIRGLKGENK